MLEVVEGVCRTSLQMAFLEHPKKGDQTDCPERSIKTRLQVKLQDTTKNVWGDWMLLSRWSPFDLICDIKITSSTLFVKQTVVIVRRS